MLRAELRRFGYMARAGGLLIKIDVMVDIDEEPVLQYLELLERICGAKITGRLEGF